MQTDVFKIILLVNSISNQMLKVSFMPTAPSCPTPPLYPTPQTPSSLSWDNIQDHSGISVAISTTVGGSIRQLRAASITYSDIVNDPFYYSTKLTIDF